MRTRNKVIAAAIGGAILLTGGSTFALWSAQDTFGGGNITAGNLNIVTGDTVITDASPDRTDRDHRIDLDTWRAVPGDTVRFETDATITLVGENLVARLTFAGFTVPEVAGARVITTITVDGVSEEIVEGLPVFFTSAEYNVINDDVDGVVFVVDADGTLDIDVTVDVYFSSATPNRELVNAQLANLTAANLLLEQVRDTGALFN